MATTPEEGLASMFANLEKMTGKSLQEWIMIGKATGIAKHRDLTAYLKTDHGLTHGYAHQISLRALAAEDAPEVGSVDLIEAQYSGAKSVLKPIYEALKTAIQDFGNDIEFSPKKAYVSLRRNKQFAMIQPTTATRVDVGLILKDVAPQGKLELSGSFNTMFTHRIRVGSLSEVDAELVAWLRKAYELA